MCDFSVACSLRSDVYKEPTDTTKKWTDQETLRLLEVRSREAGSDDTTVQHHHSLPHSPVCPLCAVDPS